MYCVRGVNILLLIQRYLIFAGLHMVIGFGGNGCGLNLQDAYEWGVLWHLTV